MISAEVKWYGKQFESIFNIDSGIIFKEEAENAIERMKNEIEKNQSSGKTYYRVKNGVSKKVVASLPGATPNNNFNDLSNSFSVTKINTQKYMVSSDSPYVIFLEFGTHKMAARPFFRRNLRKAIEKAEERIILKFKNVERFQGGK